MKKTWSFEQANDIDVQKLFNMTHATRTILTIYERIRRWRTMNERTIIMYLSNVHVDCIRHMREKQQLIFNFRF